MKRIIRLFRKYVIEEESPRFVAVTIILLTLLNKLFGMGSKLVIAYFYGADRPTDIFIAASTIPEFLASVLFIGMINAAIIPTLVSCLKHESRPDFWKHVNNLMGIMALAFAVLSFILILLARPLVFFYINNFSNDYLSDPFTPQEIDQIVYLMIALFIPQLITGLSIFVSSVLHTFNKFIIAQFAPIAYNIGNILGLLMYLRYEKDDPKALAIGMLFGAFLHLLIQVPLIRSFGYKFSWGIDFKDKYLHKLLSRGGLRVVGISIDQVYVLLSRFFSIGLIKGSLSAFTYALSIASIPFSIFGVTLSSLAFPNMSRSFIEKDEKNFQYLLISTMDKILFLALPVTVLLAILRLPTVRLAFGLFKQTSFTWEDTLLTAWVLFFLVIGIVPEALKALFIRVLFARDDVKKTVIAGVLGVLFDVVGIIVLTNFFSNVPHLSLQNLFTSFPGIVHSFPFFGYSIDVVTPPMSFFLTRGPFPAAIGGVALASSITAAVVCLVFAIDIHRSIFPIFTKGLLVTVGKKLISVTMMAITTYWAFKLWGQLLNTEKTLQIFILTVLTTGIGIITYLWFEYLLKDKVLFKIIPKWMQ